MRNSLLLLAMIVAACAQPSTPAPATTTTTAPSSSEPRIVFPDGFPVTVEIAANDETRQQGLMYRDQLAENRGMIFLFLQAGEYPFWMKNTLIPLDMIWLDASHRIVHIAHDVPPCKADPCPSYPPNAQASYVLEVAGGVAAKHHLRDGDVLRYEGLDHVAVK